MFGDCQGFLHVLGDFVGSKDMNLTMPWIMDAQSWEESSDITIPRCGSSSVSEWTKKGSSESKHCPGMQDTASGAGIERECLGTTTSNHS